MQALEQICGTNCKSVYKAGIWPWGIENSGAKLYMMRMQGSNSVEAVVCLQSLKLLPDLPRFLAEAHRVLKPGSPFIFLQPGRVMPVS